MDYKKVIATALIIGIPASIVLISTIYLGFVGTLIRIVCVMLLIIIVMLIHLVWEYLI